MIYLFWILTLTSLVTFYYESIHGAYGESAITRNNDAYWEQREPDLTKSDQTIANSLNRLSPDEKMKASKALEDRIDRILIKYRDGELSIGEALNAIGDPKILEGTGFILRKSLPQKIMTGMPTEENYELWQRAVGGLLSPPRIKDNIVIAPGSVSISLPVIENGFKLTDAPNRCIAEQLFRIYAEEMYHAAQCLRSAIPDEPSAISNYFDRHPALAKQIKMVDVGELAEADVYAKLLEALGPYLVPVRYENKYAERKLVNRLDLKSLVNDASACAGTGEFLNEAKEALSNLEARTIMEVAPGPH